MSIYSIVYILLSVILLMTVLRTRLDLITVCAICFIVYSIYCIPGIGVSGFYRPHLSPFLYGMVFLQMILIISFILITDRRERKKKTTLELEESVFIAAASNREDKKRIDTAFFIYTIIIFLFAFVNVVSVGWSTFSSGKANVWDRVNVFYVISLYGAYPSFAYGIHNREKRIWIPALLIEMTIFIAGSRAFLATMIVMLLCEFGSVRWQKNKSNMKIYLIGAVAIVFLLIYRMVDKKIMNGDFAGALSTLSNPRVWKVALEFNEPRVIIANYDYVLTQKTHLPIGDSIYRIIDFIPGLSKIIPIKLSFPEFFSDWLTKQVHGSAGVGGTIWGESYAMLGVLGIPLFTTLWLLFISKCNDHLDYPKPGSYFLVSIGTYLAWYINRLDFNRVGQACKVTLFCFLIWAAVFFILGGKIHIGRFMLGYRKSFSVKDKLPSLE